MRPLPQQSCSGVSRRSFLRVGGLALGGLSLPQLLRAEAQAGVTRSHKSVIMIFLSGGPPHQDMVDLKPAAPVEIRGEFNPIRTNVPGIDICEHLPKLAGMMDRFAVIRSLVGSEGHHAAFQCVTGRTQQAQPGGGWPSLGSIVAKLQGPVVEAMPPFVGLSPKMKTSTWANAGPAGFLGPAYAPIKPNADGMEDMALKGITVDRLDSRKDLMRRFDTFRRDADATGNLADADEYTRQALGILTSNKLAAALDLDQEDPRVRDLYGRGSPEPAGYGDAGPLLNDYFLAARRLVEAGVRVVTLAYGRWDWHGKPHGTTFENARHHLPMLDRGLTTLVEDLQQRGMDKDVTVLVWGEFGRTSRINKEGGRDHWPAVGCAMLSGGGLKTGQVIGSTDRLAEQAKDRPVHFQEVFATLYHTLGIDPTRTTVKDHGGRPHYLVDADYTPMRELI
ncbi:MAG TPA: DUF1501 domain-containing protein [Gemmataceae bacterium]|nr:DUF1501 domain-containing protein [Gemmataceae bacterium]